MGFDVDDVHVLDSRWVAMGFVRKVDKTKESKCDAVTLTG